METHHHTPSLGTVDHLYQGKILFEIQDIKTGTHGHVYQGILSRRAVYHITLAVFDHLALVAEG